jgi:hypothetical protein
MEKEFKTPIYQRTAYKKYIERKNQDPNWVKETKEKRKEYYQKNKERILKNLREKRANMKKGKPLLETPSTE